MTNLTLESEWEFVPTRPLPASCLPADMPDLACMLKVIGPHEPVLHAALRRGAKLTLYQLKAIVLAYSVNLPEVGSGKRGNRIKIDFVRAILQHFFSEDMNEEELHELATKIMGRKVEERSAEDTAELELKLLSKLDAAEAPHFQVMKKAALDTLAEDTLRAKVKKSRAVRESELDTAPAPEKAKPVFEERASGTHVKAPPEFKQLLPRGVEYLYFRWEPQSRRVAIEYPRPFSCTQSLQGSRVERNFMQ